AGGEIVIFAGGTGSGTVVTGTAPGSGGTETVFAGGIDFGTTLAGDGATEFVFGSAVSTQVDSGASLVVGASGSATGAQVFQSGSLDVQGGGTVFGATIFFSGHGSVEFGGTLISTILTGDLDVYGTASATTIESGALENVFAGGSDVSAVVSGGEQVVFGQVSGTVLDGFAVQTVE